jgi:hypothetical protein
MSEVVEVVKRSRKERGRVGCKKGGQVGWGCSGAEGKVEIEVIFIRRSEATSEGGR